MHWTSRNGTHRRRVNNTGSDEADDRSASTRICWTPKERSFFRKVLSFINIHNPVFETTSKRARRFVVKTRMLTRPSQRWSSRTPRSNNVGFVAVPERGHLRVVVGSPLHCRHRHPRRQATRVVASWWTRETHCYPPSCWFSGQPAGRKQR